MRNVFEPVKLNGKLVAKCIETGSIATGDKIRDVQIRTAFKNKQLLVVDPESGRVNRLAASIFGRSINNNVESGKSNYFEVITKRDPQVMFDNLQHFTTMVAQGIQPSLLVTGAPGLGKTYIVKNTLASRGLRESYEFVHFKGRSTAAGLFITLYQNSDKIVIFDDCDSIFKDADAVNLLKAALDSYDVRKISYITSKPLKDEFGDPIPSHFEFTGKVIFISNISQARMDAAIKSRSFVADISLTVDQMFKRIDQLKDIIEPNISSEHKDVAIAAMKQLIKQYNDVEINLRSFIKAARICAMGFDNPTSMIAEQICMK